MDRQATTTEMNLLSSSPSSPTTDSNEKATLSGRTVSSLNFPPSSLLLSSDEDEDNRNQEDIEMTDASSFESDEEKRSTEEENDKKEIFSECVTQAVVNFRKPEKLHFFTDAELTVLLRHYVLTSQELWDMGYPVEIGQYPHCIYILNNYVRHGSGSSSENSDLEEEVSPKNDAKNVLSKGSIVQRECARCMKQFHQYSKSGEYLSDEKCCYHWGKLIYSHHGQYYKCCGRELSRGCTTAKAHVWSGFSSGINGPCRNYIKTKPARSIPKNNDYGAYALDCEMLFTKNGMEVGKISVIRLDGSVVYETLIKPASEVIDYNTRFSGLNAKNMAMAIKTLKNVQKDLRKFITAETILIGHGLENDLRKLRIVHPAVIDTTKIFPHFLGLPYRRSLKTLARTILGKEIQVKAHDSSEDARTILELLFTKVECDLLNGQLPMPKYYMF